MFGMTLRDLAPCMECVVRSAADVYDSRETLRGAVAKYQRRKRMQVARMHDREWAKAHDGLMMATAPPSADEYRAAAALSSARATGHGRPRSTPPALTAQHGGGTQAPAWLGMQASGPSGRRQRRRRSRSRTGFEDARVWRPVTLRSTTPTSAMRRPTAARVRPAPRTPQPSVLGQRPRFVGGGMMPFASLGGSTAWTPAPAAV